MADSIQRPPRQRGLGQFFATVTLAHWQLRLTWRLLLVVGLGVLAAVILVCTVPLYSQVATSAGLRDAFASAGNAPITIHSEAHLISQAATQKISAQIQQEMQQNLGSFLGGSQFTVQSSALQVGKTNEVQLFGWSMSDAHKHVSILAGRLPQETSKTLEVALTPQAATGLHVAVGTTLTVPMQFLSPADTQITVPLALHIVGIFQPTAAHEAFWHGTSFQSQAFNAGGALYPVLVANESYLAALDTASQTASRGNPQNGTTFELPSDLYWYYTFNLAHLDSNTLDTLSAGLNTVLVGISNQPVVEPFVDKTTSTGPSDLVSGYSDRVTVARIPLLSLAYLIAGLMLFFVSVMTDLLVDRQAEAIAILRSRGASRQQIFLSLVTQSIGVGIGALLIGPPIAVLLTRLLVQLSLPAHDQGAFAVIFANPLAAALNLYLAACATVVVSILAMLFALNRASRLDVLALRKETARTARGSAWLRLGLDILAGVIALTGYAFSLYITTPGVLDVRTRVLLLPPMTLVGAVFLLLGCMLLFLRVFPFILQGLSHLAVRRRGATSMLAVAQMARAPRQSLRMTLLLALAVAFGIFSLVFSATQAQRIPSVAAYQTGADFSGTYPNGSKLNTSSLAQQEAAFLHIPGVTSASVGYTSSTTGAQSGADVSIELRAVDATTFAHTALWNSQDSSQPLSSLMAQLVKQRPAATSNNAQGVFVPAIVDQAAWQSLSLVPGAPFTLADLNGTINFVAIAEVQRIPTVSDSATASGTNQYVAQGGVLADFVTYQAAVKAASTAQPPLVPAPSTVWLSTQGDAASLASVRAALASGPLRLTGVNDRQAQESAMRSNPLYLALLGVLLIGAATALLLGLLGNLTVSWLSARSRLLSFAVMRALGTAPRQIASVLSYEQAIIYATAIGLGVAFGLLLSFLVLPAFVFTSSLDSTQAGTGVFYVTQSVPPIQLFIPGLLIALAIGILVAICLVALGMMIRIVSRPAVSNTLRMSSD